MKPNYEEILMKMAMKQYLSPLAITLLASLFFSFSIKSMGDGEKTNTTLEPSFAHLEEGGGSFSAKVYDDNTITELKDLSFFGHTDVGGIRCEKDDSMIKLDLAHLKEIKVLQPGFESKRYSNQEFSLATIIVDNDVVMNDLLIPRHIVICGIEKKTSAEKAWFLNKISRLVILGAKDEDVPQKRFVEKIFPAELPKTEIIKEEKKIMKAREEAQKAVEMESKMEKKTFLGAVNDLIVAIVSVFKALLGIVKALFGF
jgi:hypothetical protein